MNIPLPLKEVKSYLHPKFKEIIDQETTTNYRIDHHYPHDLMVNPPPDLAAQFFAAWRTWVKPSVSGLDKFEYAYLGNGSSECIRELARTSVAQASRGYLTMRPGEYEGWRYYVQAMGGATQTANFENSSVMYLSNPSAINGNWMDDRQIEMLYANHYEILLDMAYLNTTALRVVDVSQAKAVFFSASKSLGLFGHRVGMVFTKEPIPALLGNNLWFHNPVSLSIVMRIIEQYPLGWLHSQMQAEQALAVNHYRANGIPNMQESDSFLIGNSVRGGLHDYKRNFSTWRYCLQPYYVAEKSEAR